MAIRRSEYLIGTEPEFVARNPILSKGQLAVITPDNLMKFGNGVTRFIDLPYATAGGTVTGPFDGGSP